VPLEREREREQWNSGLLFADMLNVWSREHEMDSVMERIIINADYDDNDDTSECSVSCVDNDDIQGDGPVFSNSE
jgi:hypothetical protein